MLKKCTQCSFVFVNPRPSEKDLLLHYNENFFRGEIRLPGRCTKNYFEGISSYTGRSKKLLSNLNKYKNSGRLLDIGCGLGYLIEQAQMEGWKAMGLEISDFAISICKKKGLNVRKGQIGEIEIPKNHFDVVIAQDVLEHVFDPEKFLDNINKVMKNSGLLILELPNNSSIRSYLGGKKWAEYIPPVHLNFFDKTTLRKILGNHGFKVITIYSETSLTLGLRERLRKLNKDGTKPLNIFVTRIDELITSFKKNIFYPPLNYISKTVDIHGDLLIAYVTKKDL